MSKHRFKRSFRAGGAAAVLRGLLFSMAVTLVLTLLFALLIGWTDMSDTAIRLINQVIKIGAIVFGACFSIPRGDERALRRDGKARAKDDRADLDHLIDQANRRVAHIRPADQKREQ